MEDSMPKAQSQQKHVGPALLGVMVLFDDTKTLEPNTVVMFYPDSELHILAGRPPAIVLRNIGVFNSVKLSLWERFKAWVKSRFKKTGDE